MEVRKRHETSGEERGSSWLLVSIILIIYDTFSVTWKILSWWLFPPFQTILSHLLVSGDVFFRDRKIVNERGRIKKENHREREGGKNWSRACQVWESIFMVPSFKKKLIFPVVKNNPKRDPCLDYVKMSRCVTLSMSSLFHFIPLFLSPFLSHSFLLLLSATSASMKIDSSSLTFLSFHKQ